MLEFIGGLLMSLGGSVPGVSGGTIAFLMGFFDEMLNSVNTFLSKKSTQKKKSFFFLLRLVGGYLLGLALATFLIKRFFAEHIYPVSSLFLGVTLFSVPLIVKEEFGTLKGKFKEALWILPGVAAIVGNSNGTSVCAVNQGVLSRFAYQRTLVQQLNEDARQAHQQRGTKIHDKQHAEGERVEVGSQEAIRGAMSHNAVGKNRHC